MFKTLHSVPGFGALLSVAAIVLAACAPAPPTADTAATEDAMHAAETQAAGEAMHAAETQAAEDSMHVAETQAAEEAMHAAETEAASEGELTLDFTGLTDLGEGLSYAGWLIVDETPVSTGVFTVDGNGIPSETTFVVNASDLESATAFVLTVEESPDPDPAPSAIKLLGGEFVNGTAILTSAFPAALGDDLSGTAGSYILAAPSAGEGGEYTSGIWWLDPAAGPGPSLDLPDLPEGWAYEGWVVGPDGPISTGRFTSASGADSDGAGPTAGPNEAPPFPGQDFVDPRLDLTSGYMAVISIEPEPDTGPEPFLIKPLVDMMIDDTGEAGVLQTMENVAGSLPRGTATR